MDYTYRNVVSVSFVSVSFRQVLCQCHRQISCLYIFSSLLYRVLTASGNEYPIFFKHRSLCLKLAILPPQNGTFCLVAVYYPLIIEARAIARAFCEPVTLL